MSATAAPSWPLPSYVTPSPAQLPPKPQPPPPFQPQPLSPSILALVDFLSKSPSFPFFRYPFPASSSTLALQHQQTSGPSPGSGPESNPTSNPESNPDSNASSSSSPGIEMGAQDVPSSTAITPTLEYAFPAFSQSRGLIIKPHRRDQFIEWIKGLLAAPFLLIANGLLDEESTLNGKYDDIKAAHTRYAEIMRHVENLVNDHFSRQNGGTSHTSNLAQEVHNVGPFFTRLPLEAAFKFQDTRRRMSSRQCIPPSFHDVRLMLNTAQLMAIAEGGLRLATFDGDMTLYDDGECLKPDNPVIARILALLQRNVRIGIVTAAGYPSAAQYHVRLYGLLDAVATSPLLTPKQRANVVIMGGEANYLFTFDATAPHLLQLVPREQWMFPEMAAWSEPEINRLLDTAEAALRERVAALGMPATILRKERAVGIIPSEPGVRLIPESLEETVLAVERALVRSGSVNGPATPSAKGRVSFCAFNGGRDVFVDIGDKSWGVRVCQNWFGRRDGLDIQGENTLHVGDQFLSAGSNDYKARTVSTTAWIASPEETVELLDELVELVGAQDSD